MNKITRSYYSIKRESFKFECSHRLNHLTYDSPCKNIHGHSYKVFIELFAKQLDEHSMIIDFSKLKKFQDYLDEYYDHAIIICKNDIELLEAAKKLNCKYLIYDTWTTAENMAKTLTDQLFNLNIITDNINKIIVTVYETEKNSASYTTEQI